MKCNKCGKKFDDQSRMPYVLTCKHSVCSVCLIKNEEETDQDQFEYRNHVQTCANDFLAAKKEEVVRYEKELTTNLDTKKYLEDQNSQLSKVIKENQKLIIGFFDSNEHAEKTIKTNEKIIKENEKTLKDLNYEYNELKSTYQTKKHLVDVLLDNKSDHFFTYKCPICLLKIKAVPFSNINEMNKIIESHGLSMEEEQESYLERVSERASEMMSSLFAFNAKKNKKSVKKNKKSVKKNKKSVKKNKKSVKKNKKSVRKSKKF
jgi:histone H1/5